VQPFLHVEDNSVANGGFRVRQQTNGDRPKGSDSIRAVVSTKAKIHRWIAKTYFSEQLKTNPNSDTLLLFGGTFMVGGLVAVALSFGLNVFSFVVARVMLYTSAALLVVGLALWAVHATCLSLGYIARIEHQLWGDSPR